LAEIKILLITGYGSGEFAVCAAYGACTNEHQHWADGKRLDDGILADVHTDGCQPSWRCKLSSVV